MQQSCKKINSARHFPSESVVPSRTYIRCEDSIGLGVILEHRRLGFPDLEPFQNVTRSLQSKVLKKSPKRNRIKRYHIITLRAEIALAEMVNFPYEITTRFILLERGISM
jgi:hypothetical protein